MSWYQQVDAAVTASADGVAVHQAFDAQRIVPFAQGGPPVFTVAFYVGIGPPVHWHLITFGLSAEDSTDPGSPIGGAELELSLRVQRATGEDTAPMWAVLLLRYAARVIRQGMRLDVPSLLPPLPKPITHAGPPPDYDRESGLTALAVTPDPTLSSRGIRFAQLFGLYPEEFAVLEADPSRGLLARIQETNPLLITDLWRERLL